MKTRLYTNNVVVSGIWETSRYAHSIEWGRGADVVRSPCRFETYRPHQIL